jgi:hypothetical protein
MKGVLTLNILLRTRLAPSISAQLYVAAEDLRCAEVEEEISFSLPDTFIQPFREDRDSRNEYKSQVRISCLSYCLSCPSVCVPVSFCSYAMMFSAQYCRRRGPVSHT